LRTPKVLVIGLDGATFDLLEPMMKEGRLPNLSEIADQGSAGRMRSTIPPATLPAWISMASGRNPGKLGVYDFLYLDRDEMKLHVANTSKLHGMYVWDYLGRAGYRVGVMNVPGTYPPYRVNGFIVTGMLTPSRARCTYPPGLKEELDRAVDGYELDVTQWKYFDWRRFLEDAYRVLDKRRRAAEWLMERFSCDFYMFVFTCTDRVQHFLWHRREVVEEFWEHVDEAVGRLVKKHGEGDVFIVSDHGFGPLRRTFFTNEWLKRRRLLRMAKTRRGLKAAAGGLLEYIYYHLGSTRPIQAAMSALEKYMGFTWIWKTTFGHIFSEDLAKRVDWSETVAFSCPHSPHFGHVYLNKKGEYGRVLEEFKKLSSEGVNVRFFRREELYNGPYVEKAPEIIFCIDDFECEVDSRLTGRIFMKGSLDSRWSGTHKLYGIFMASGPHVRRGVRVEASIYDVTPTVLRLFGQPVPGDMDGRVLTEVLEAEGSEAGEGAEEREGGVSGGLSEEEEAEIIERLRRLGYLG